MAAAAVLDNRKISISRPRFDGFRPNLARRRSSTLLNVPTVKHFRRNRSFSIICRIFSHRLQHFNSFWVRANRNCRGWTCP